MRCSIVVRTDDRLDLTRACLGALDRTVPPGLAEIVVVSDASSTTATDATRTFEGRLGGRVRSVRCETGQGFARACNRGASAARGERLVFLNNDLLPRPGWLEALLDPIERDASVGGVGARLRYPDGRVKHAGVVFARRSLVPYNLYRGAPGDWPETRRRRELRAVSGCLLVSRTVFERLGGFDPGYRDGLEEVDLCLRIRDLGLRILYQPASEVIHLESRAPGHGAHDGVNLERFLARWRGRLFPDEDWVLHEDGCGSRLRLADGCMVQQVERLLDSDESARWSLPARAQRALWEGDPSEALQKLLLAESWPDETDVLLWAHELCGNLGAGEQRERFARRIGELSGGGQQPDFVD